MARLISKPIRYQKHALHRMKYRAITEAEVRKAISDPHDKRPAERPNATRFTHQLNGTEIIVVIAEETPKDIWVISTWKTHA